MSAPMRHRTEQERARMAWDLVNQVNTQQSDYLSYVRSASTLILSNGLAQTLAFWDAKKGKDDGSVTAYQDLIKHLNKMVLDSETESLLNKAINCDSTPIYRKYTKEALACLLWLKRFAEGKFTKQESSSNESNSEG